MTLLVDDIITLYQTVGTRRYGNEAVSQEQHALQCGQLAEQAGCLPELVAAALLHDLGHLISAGRAQGVAKDDFHEFAAIPFLRGVFPYAVIEPIRLHVQAKRYLCATEPGYWETLSPGSKHSLSLQGGPLGPVEAKRFLQQPFGSDAVALRRRDDQARSATATTRGWGHYRDVLQAACDVELDELAV